MATELLAALRFVVVSALPGGAAQGDSVVLASNGHLYTYDGTTWVDNGATGGGGGGETYGSATVDFGAAPGSSLATTVVSGQSGLLATSKVRVWLQGDTTATHNAYEHLIAPIILRAGDLGTGTFTVYAVAAGLRLTGTFTVRWAWSV